MLRSTASRALLCDVGWPLYSVSLKVPPANAGCASCASCTTQGLDVWISGRQLRNWWAKELIFRAGSEIRVLQLWKQQSLATGLVWATKIITDPFHDTKLYCGAPLRLLRGELIDPMDSLRKHG